MQTLSKEKGSYLSLNAFPSRIDEMSHVHEDIGSNERLKPEEKAALYRRFKPAPDLSVIRTDKETQEARHSNNLAIIRTIAPSIEENTVPIEIVVSGKKFLFWPSSDTWFSESKGLYGTGIADIVGKIRRLLLQTEVAS